MNKMVLSPMQQDYVTKEEFGEFKDEMLEFKGEMHEFKEEMMDFKEDTKKRFDWVEEGFDMTNRHIDELESIVNNRFDLLETKLVAEIDGAKMQLLEAIGKIDAE